MPYETAFEHPFGEGALTGTASLEVLDPSGYKPVTIIQLDHAWQLKVKMTVNGSAAPFVAGLTGGKWVVQAFLEAKGADWEKKVAEETIPTATAGSPYLYSKTINVPKGEDMNQPAGPYKLTVAITLRDAAKPYEIAAFCEGPMLQFYTA